MSALEGSGALGTGAPEIGLGADSLDARRQRFLVVCRRHPGLIALPLYILGVLVMQRHAVAHMGSVISGNGVADPTQFMWTEWWWPHAVAHAINPFITHEIWVNDPYNLASSTSIPLPSLLAWPATTLFGPIVAYNLLNLLAPVLSAYCGYRLCRYLTHNGPAAILGGWLFGFCSYALGQSQGHLNLVWTFGAPLLLELALRRLDRRLARVRFILLGALVVIAELLCSTEIVFTMSCMAAVAFVVAFILGPGLIRRRLGGLVLELIPVYVLAGAVCSVYLYYALTGPAINVGIAPVYPADLLSFVLPTPVSWIGGSSFASTSAHFLAGFCEGGTYLGLPLIAIILFNTVDGRRRPRTWVLLAVVLVGFVFSLGPFLNVNGHSSISLPFKLIGGYKGFNQLLPVRIGLYIEMAAALIAAIWVSRPDVKRRWLRWGVALLAAAFLFPNANAVEPTGASIYSESYASLPFFTDGLYSRYLYPNEVVLPLPFGLIGPSLLWQSQAKGYFRLASGWFGYWPSDYYNDPVVMQLIGFKSMSSPDPVSGMRAFLLNHLVGAVVVQDGQNGAWAGVFAKLGLTPIHVGGVELYRIPVNKAGGAVLH